MIDALKAAIEAEKAKLLAELSQAAEPRSFAIRKEIEACESLLARLQPIARRLIDRAPRAGRPPGNGRPLLRGRDIHRLLCWQAQGRQAHRLDGVRRYRLVARLWSNSVALATRFWRATRLRGVGDRG